MKAVVISVQPKWCELIANGKKTIEVRKTKPKIEKPFKCYIYCTKAKNKASVDGYTFFADELYIDHWSKTLTCGHTQFEEIVNGKVIGEFTCVSISEYEAEFHKGNDVYQDIREIFRDPDNPDDDCRDFRILTANDDDDPNDCEFCKQTCLTFDEVKSYIGEECFCKTFYGWHISNLKIYDKPKELSAFKKHNRHCHYEHLGLATPKCSECKECQLERPPQSWGYVEELT